MFAKSIKVRGCVAAIVLLMSLLSACEDSHVINIGHGAYGGYTFGMIPSILIGIRSERNEFDINDVTLDFSFGNEEGIDEDSCCFIDRGEKGVMPEECPIIGVAVYFYDYDNRGFSSNKYHYEDYKAIEKWCFVKFITIDDFNENYKVDYSYRGRTKYDHTETLTIPQEVFENTIGLVYISALQVAYIPSENAYMFHGGSTMELDYKLLENGKIRLS